MLTSLFNEIATGLGLFVPTFATAFLDAFTNLFIVVDSTTQAVSFTPVGSLGLAMLVIYITYKVMPTVISWFKLYMAKRKARKAAAKR